MASPTHSASAELVAVSRAVHQFHDDEPLILRDPLALRIIGQRSQAWMNGNLAMFDQEWMRRMRGMVTVRSRFCEDELRDAVSRGTGQYVILGAGLDTFAYRSHEFADRLTVYEVDQAETQDWKRQRLVEAGIEIPSNLRFVTADFTRDDLAGVLADAGFDRSAPAFFAWLGVSYYLSREAILAMLEFVAAQGTDAQIVFDFAVDESAVPVDFHPHLRRLRDSMATVKETWKTWFKPAELRAELARMGFGAVEYLDAPGTCKRYLAGRNDGVLSGPLVGLISARRRR